MRCHTIGIHIKFLNYPQQSPFWDGMRNTEVCHKVILYYPYNICQSATWLICIVNKLRWNRIVVMGRPVYSYNLKKQPHTNTALRFVLTKTFIPYQLKLYNRKIKYRKFWLSELVFFKSWLIGNATPSKWCKVL